MWSRLLAAPAAAALGLLRPQASIGIGQAGGLAAGLPQALRYGPEQLIGRINVDPPLGSAEALMGALKAPNAPSTRHRPENNPPMSDIHAR